MSWLGKINGNATPGPGDGLLVLPRQCTGPPPRWRHIKIAVEENKVKEWIIAVVRSDNMYCKGIINMGWYCYELREKDPNRKLPPEYNAIDAGCDVSYHSMIGCRLEDVKQKLIDEGLGFGSAVRSVKILSRYHPAHLNPEDRRPGMPLASLVFSFVEAARMNPRCSGLGAENDGRYWSIGPELTSQLWDLSKNWRYMPYTVLDCRDTGEWTPNKYLDGIGRTTRQLAVGTLSIVLNSPEWYYEIAGQKPTRMELVLDPEKQRWFKQLALKRLMKKKKRRLMVMGPSSP
ncbi:uncharacterized protein LOC120656718 [Panicum virgatum]|uniref:rRNA N-glycosylase n=1 Tax=Panicum virgatum TaxID=38727 RepID=A0A8T0XBQ9_PANVG|nr:uncharacterized protein LOC120656718 [Panicum virgatum]KAG2652869.1 hypothetical protein PVAP13_1NG390400 [Panicum virgatum]